MNPLKKEDPHPPYSNNETVDFFNDYAGILAPWSDRIPLSLGSHIHRMTYIAPKSSKHPDLDLKILVSPSITPVYFNDPGFTVVHLDKDKDSRKLKIAEISLRFFSFSNIFMYNKPVWRNFEVSKQLRIDVDSTEELRNHWQSMMHNP